MPTVSPATYDVVMPITIYKMGWDFKLSSFFRVADPENTVCAQGEGSEKGATASLHTTETPAPPNYLARRT